VRATDFTLTLALKGEENKESFAAGILVWGLLFVILGRRGFHFAHGAGLAAGRAFLGFAAGIHLIAAFFAGKDGHG
jgi:hypothetical protein